jgi:hypothetical protein
VAIVLFWWFLLLGRHPVVVGPLPDAATCDTIAAQAVEDGGKVTSCWSDEQPEPRRTVRN